MAFSARTRPKGVLRESDVPSALPTFGLIVVADLLEGVTQIVARDLPPQLDAGFGGAAIMHARPQTCVHDFLAEVVDCVEMPDRIEVSRSAGGGKAVKV